MKQRGTTLLEASLVLALVGLLAGLGFSRLDPGSPGLGALEGELRGCLEQALLRAQAQGCELRVALQGAEGAVGPVGATPPLHLPKGVRWGLPEAGIPLPPGMAQPLQAHRTGAAHPSVTVTPRHTAQASVWFLTDGRDALCLRLSDEGRLQLLRWCQRQRQWTRR